MKLTDDFSISRWAYEQCRYKNNNTSQIRKLITDSFDCYCYCLYINNDKEIRKRIKDKTMLIVLNNIIPFETLNKNLILNEKDKNETNK